MKQFTLITLSAFSLSFTAWADIHDIYKNKTLVRIEAKGKKETFQHDFKEALSLAAQYQGAVRLGEHSPPILMCSGEICQTVDLLAVPEGVSALNLKKYFSPPRFEEVHMIDTTLGTYTGSTLIKVYKDGSFDDCKPHAAPRKVRDWAVAFKEHRTEIEPIASLPDSQKLAWLNQNFDCEARQENESKTVSYLNAGFYIVNDPGCPTMGVNSRSCFINAGFEVIQLKFK